MKKTIFALGISALLTGNPLKSQVTPVNPSSFAGQYFTEVKMKVSHGSFSKKTNEINLTFDEKKGLLSGLVDGAKEGMDPLMFHADITNRTNAAKTGIWYWANGNSNGSTYGKEMFDYNQMTVATFIEDGVLVICALYGGADKAVRAFDVPMDEKRIRIMAKDKSKLTMNKLDAAKKAQDMINAAAGENIKKVLNDQAKAAFAVPNETLSKNDKELKKEVVEFFMNIPLHPDDQSEFLCAYTTSNDWTIITNKLTGVILGREINAEMIRKGKVSGKCRRNPYTLSQQYNGSGYGKLTFKQKWDQIECDCAQVDKNK